jgi:hypothetical protein
MGHNSQLKNGALQNPDMTWKQGVTAVNAIMPAGANPTIVVQSLYIRSESVFWACFQQDPGVAAPLSITAFTVGFSGSAKVAPTNGSVTIKAYGTLANARNITLFITETLGVGRV